MPIPPASDHGLGQQLDEVHQREAAERDAMILAMYPILQHFSFKHLPVLLQSASEPFHDMAWEQARRACTADDRFVIGYFVRAEPELAEGLRKLLEAKDCFVRARRMLKE